MCKAGTYELVKGRSADGDFNTPVIPALMREMPPTAPHPTHSWSLWWPLTPSPPPPPGVLLRMKQELNRLSPSTLSIMELYFRSSRYSTVQYSALQYTGPSLLCPAPMKPCMTVQDKAV